MERTSVSTPFSRRRSDRPTTNEIINRLHIGAKRKALRHWPTLVARETAMPEPNLIRPRPLVTIGDLEEFFYRAMYRNIFQEGQP